MKVLFLGSIILTLIRILDCGSGSPRTQVDLAALGPAKRLQVQSVIGNSNKLRTSKLLVAICGIITHVLGGTLDSFEIHRHP